MNGMSRASRDRRTGLSSSGVRFIRSTLSGWSASEWCSACIEIRGRLVGPSAASSETSGVGGGSSDRPQRESALRLIQGGRGHRGIVSPISGEHKPELPCCAVASHSWSVLRMDCAARRNTQSVVTPCLGPQVGSVLGISGGRDASARRRPVQSAGASQERQGRQNLRRRRH